MNFFIKISSLMKVYSIHYLKEFKRLHAELLNITKSLILLILYLERNSPYSNRITP
jgi:hypothetical protein